MPSPKLLAAALAVASCSAFASPSIPVLVYHRVTIEHPASATVISPQAFESHLARIKELGYRTLTISQLESSMQSGLIPERAVAITFDDGWKDNLYAAELLLKHQLTATFYVMSSFNSERYLSKDDVRKLAVNFEIGSHSHTHLVEWADLAAVDERMLYGEAVMSRALLEDVIGRPVTSFAWPYGYFRPQMLPLMSKLGYTSTVHINSETLENRKGGSLMFIQRLNVSGRCSPDHLQLMLTTGKLTEC